MSRLRQLLLFCSIVIMASPDQVDAEEPKVNVETLLSGLDNPSAVAVQPGTSVIFVAEGGTGQIIKVADEKDAQPAAVITGFPTHAYGKQKYALGPLGLGFQSPSLLIVASGVSEAGGEVVRQYKLPSAPAEAVAFDKTEQAIDLAKPRGEDGQLAHACALLVGPTAVYALSHTDAQKPAIAKADITNLKIGEFKPLIALPSFAPRALPWTVPFTLSKKGFMVAVEPAAEADTKESNLAFYAGKTGKLLMRLPMELSEVTALVYSPKTDRLYALNFGESDPATGGLYRLDAAVVNGQSGVEAVQVTPLDRPTGMAFGNDNRSLYVTAFGETKNGAAGKVGKLLKITPADKHEL